MWETGLNKTGDKNKPTLAEDKKNEIANVAEVGFTELAQRNITVGIARDSPIPIKAAPIQNTRATYAELITNKPMAAEIKAMGNVHFLVQRTILP